mgnify:CR=1 FL=1|tara:strand:- start:2393 stop:2833 length:441 start_codon:yes stop_codon:yes gene_type:complete
MESTKKIFVVYGEDALSHRKAYNKTNHDRYYPVCATAKKFKQLMKTDTWTLSALQNIEDLDFEVITFTNWIGLTEWDEEVFVYRNWLIRKHERHDDGWVVYAPSSDSEKFDLDDYTAVDHYDTLEDAVRTIDLFNDCLYKKPSFIK